MTDSYQAIYDAVRSRISNGDIGRAVESAVSQANIGHYADMMRHSFLSAAAQYERPSVLWRPAIYPDGNKWCALYGTDLQEGVAGFGDTPEEAMAEFDKAWAESLAPKAAP